MVGGGHRNVTHLGSVCGGRREVLLVRTIPESQVMMPSLYAVAFVGLTPHPICMQGIGLPLWACQRTLNTDVFITKAVRGHSGKGEMAHCHIIRRAVPKSIHAYGHPQEETGGAIDTLGMSHCFPAFNEQIKFPSPVEHGKSGKFCSYSCLFNLRNQLAPRLPCF